MKALFEDYFVSNQLPLFDEVSLGGKENKITLLKIILTTSYYDLNPERYYIYSDIVEKFFLKYCLDLNQDHNELYYCWALSNTKEKYQLNKAELAAILEQQTSNWKKSANKTINLYAMVSVFLGIIEIQAESEKSLYDANIRYMMKCIFRNLMNGIYHFTNFQILNVMECLHIEFSEQTKTKRPGENPEAIEVLQKIRNTTKVSFKNHSEFEKQLIKMQAKISPLLNRPQKFFFEKISNEDKASRSIIIAVSGFTSEDCSKQELYKGLVKEFPNTEIFALNWKAYTMNSIYQTILKEVNEFASASQGIILGIAFTPLAPLTMTYATIKAYKDIKKDMWGKIGRAHV